mgnify:CR=1 FL=1
MVGQPGQPGPPVSIYTSTIDYSISSTHNACTIYGIVFVITVTIQCLAILIEIRQIV